MWFSGFLQHWTRTEASLEHQKNAPKSVGRNTPCMHRWPTPTQMSLPRLSCSHSWPSGSTCAKFVNFAAVSKECRVAAHWQLHAALLAALRLSLVQQDAAIRNSAAVGFTGLVREGSPRGAAFIQIAPALITTTHMWSGERGADDLNIAVLALVAMVAMLDGVLMVELVLKCGFLTAALSVTCSLTAVTVAMVATVAAMELETSKKIKIVCTVFTHTHRLKMIRTELQRRIVCLETWQFAPFCEVCRTLEAAADIQRVRRWRSIAARRRCQRR